MLNEISKRIKLQLMICLAMRVMLGRNFMAIVLYRNGTSLRRKQKIAFRFYYRKDAYREWEIRNSFVMTTKVIKENTK